MNRKIKAAAFGMGLALVGAFGMAAIPAALADSSGPDRKFRLVVDAQDGVEVDASLIFFVNGAQYGESCRMHVLHEHLGFKRGDVCMTASDSPIKVHLNVKYPDADAFADTVIEPLKPIQELKEGKDGVVDVCFEVYKKKVSGLLSTRLYSVQWECSGPTPDYDRPMNDNGDRATTHLRDGEGLSR